MERQLRSGKHSEYVICMITRGDGAKETDALQCRDYLMSRICRQFRDIGGMLDEVHAAAEEEGGRSCETKERREENCR